MSGSHYELVQPYTWYVTDFHPIGVLATISKYYSTRTPNLAAAAFPSLQCMCRRFKC